MSQAIDTAEAFQKFDSGNSFAVIFIDMTTTDAKLCTGIGGHRDTLSKHPKFASARITNNKIQLCINNLGYYSSKGILVKKNQRNVFIPNFDHDTFARHIESA